MPWHLRWNCPIQRLRCHVEHVGRHVDASLETKRLEELPACASHHVPPDAGREYRGARAAERFQSE